MLKQAFWFAAAGAMIAVLAGGAGDLAIWVETTSTTFDGGTRFTTTYVGLPWAHVRAGAVTGAVVGASIGLAAYAFGIRMVAQAGRRLGRVVAAGVVGVTLGLMPTLVYVASVLRGLDVNESVGIDPVSLLTLYGVSAALAYCAALLAVWLVLRTASDGLAGRTTRCTAWLLPVGTVVATGLGVGAAWLYDFTAHAYTFAVVIVVVTLVLSMTFAASRSWALRERSVAA